jgi:hypothetical protein
VKKLILAVFLFVATSSNALAQTAIRVNWGGANYSDSKGQLWSANYGYTGGLPSSLTGVMKGTNNPILFQTGRYANSSAGLYSFNVPNGPYHVSLYFAETYAATTSVGARVFNVKVQGALVFSSLDVFGQAGADTPLSKGTDVTVTNGTIRIELNNIVQTAKVNAIEILPGNPVPQLPLKFQYPDGTPVAGNVQLYDHVDDAELQRAGTSGQWTGHMFAAGQSQHGGCEHAIYGVGGLV